MNHLRPPSWRSLFIHWGQLGTSRLENSGSNGVYSARALPFVAAGGGRLMVDENMPPEQHRALMESMPPEHRALAELHNALLSELTAEIRTVVRGKAGKELSQSERRMFIRVSFATIEALIFVMKQIALAAHPDPKCPTISEAERAFAMEQDFKLTSSGDVERRAAKIPLETNIRFAFRLLAKASNAPTVLDVSGTEWRSLLRAIKVRDRITHPKNISNLTISDEELSDVVIGFKWVLTSRIKLGNDVRQIAILREQSETPSTNE